MVTAVYGRQMPYGTDSDKQDLQGGDFTLTSLHTPIIYDV